MIGWYSASRTATVSSSTQTIRPSAAISAVLHAERLAGLVRADHLGRDALAVVFVQHADEEARLEPLRHRVAEHALDLRAHVRRLQRQPDRVDVRRERELLDERAVLRLGLAEALFVLVALRDVAQRDREQQRPRDVDARDRELGRERPAVGAKRGDLEA